MPLLAPPPSYENLSAANAPYSVATTSERLGLDVVEPPFTSLDVIEGMLNAPSNLDWVSSMIQDLNSLALRSDPSIAFVGRTSSASRTAFKEQQPLVS